MGGSPKAPQWPDGHILVTRICRLVGVTEERSCRDGRLNRSGDRQANSALWHIVFTRMVNDPRTKHYIERRMKEGRTKKEAIRCLKRYVAREVFAALPRSEFALDSPQEHRSGTERGQLKPLEAWPEVVVT